MLSECLERLDRLLPRYTPGEMRAELMFLQSELEAVRAALNARHLRAPGGEPPPRATP